MCGVSQKKSVTKPKRKAAKSPEQTANNVSQTSFSSDTGGSPPKRVCSSPVLADGATTGMSHPVNVRAEKALSNHALTPKTRPLSVRPSKSQPDKRKTTKPSVSKAVSPKMSQESTSSKSLVERKGKTAVAAARGTKRSLSPSPTLANGSVNGISV